MADNKGNVEGQRSSETAFDSACATDNILEFSDVKENVPRIAAPEKSKTWKVGTLTYTTGGLFVLFFWLLWGDFAWAMRERSVGAVFLIMLKKYQATDFLTGILIGSLPQGISLMLSPMISCWSDRCRSRWGRRIPFLLFSTPIIVFSMVLLAFCPMIGTWLNKFFGGNPESLNVTILGIYCVAWTCFDFGALIGNSVFGGLINDVVPHTVIGRFYGLFRALSLIAGIAFNYFLIGKAEDFSLAIFLGIGALYGFGFTSMCLKVKEGTYPPPAPRAAGAGFHPVKSVKIYFKECFSIPYYVYLFGMIALFQAAAMSAFLFSVYMAKSYDLSMDKYGICLAITYAFSLALSYPLGAFADRFHPLRVGLATIGFHVVVTLCGALFISSAQSFAVIFVLQGVVCGMYFTSTAGLLQMLLPKEKFSQFASANGIVASVTIMVISPLLGKILDWSGHAYWLTFAGSCLFTVLALGAGIVVYRKFLGYGGFENYKAPEID